ncbi:hypothetical protein [Moorena producens]|uniref:hypothetical protein n=1 Tax=Moorena producens TaxID=1155739 RepID=UPI001054EAAC|nr:hypothetical protein [Moorena producens]
MLNAECLRWDDGMMGIPSKRIRYSWVSAELPITLFSHILTQEFGSISIKVYLNAQLYIPQLYISLSCYA